MSLFFDREWFDERLAALGLSKAELAVALGLAEGDIDAMWKDQRELKAGDVRILAALLGVEPREIAHRAGISTPVPTSGDHLAAVMVRLERIEQMLVELKTEVAALRKNR